MSEENKLARVREIYLQMTKFADDLSKRDPDERMKPLYASQLANIVSMTMDIIPRDDLALMAVYVTIETRLPEMTYEEGIFIAGQVAAVIRGRFDLRSDGRHAVKRERGKPSVTLRLVREDRDEEL